MSALIADERRRFYQLLMESGVYVQEKGIPTNADKDQAASVAFAGHIGRQLGLIEGHKRSGQTQGKLFEEAVASFLQGTFPHYEHIRPGQWTIERVGSTSSTAGVSRFAQYKHLADLDRLVKSNQTLRATLGNGYAIAPDVIILREPETDDRINTNEDLVDDEVSVHADLRSRYQPFKILHAVVSCKYTFRSDRAQNARSEGLNLIRNRKGRLPHIVVVTAEPSPSRLASIALGTGDVDCVYSFALSELVAAVDKYGNSDNQELLSVMINGRRLKDISDLPLDLAV